MPQIVISLPDDRMEYIDRECEITGETYSAFIVRLLDGFAKRQKEADDIERYRRGYEKYPETEEEIALSMALARDAFSADYWDDDFAKMSRGEIPYDDNHPLADASRQTEE